MRLGRFIARRVTRHIVKEVNRRATYDRVQREAAIRPESVRVETADGVYWMSPIEFKLYEAMRHEGLYPVPQFRVEGYIVDFAFPDIMLAIEADGVSYHTGERRDRDRRRDWILSRKGWSVKRFYGTTIHNRASNCAYIINKEVSARRIMGRR